MEPVLSLREPNRATLARQLLLEGRHAPVTRALGVAPPPWLRPEATAVAEGLHDAIRKFDNLVVSHRHRDRVTADEHRGDLVGAGWFEATFFVAGLVADVREVEYGRAVVEPFAPLPRVVRRQVDDEAKRREAWLR